MVGWFQDRWAVACVLAAVAVALSLPVLPLAAGWQLLGLALCFVCLFIAAGRIIAAREERLLRAPLVAIHAAATERLDGNLMADMPEVEIPELRALCDLWDEVLKNRAIEDDGIHAMQMPIVAVAPTGKIMMANHSAVGLFGYQNQGELVLEDAQVLLPAEDDRQWILSAQPDTATAGKRQSIAVRSDGSTFQIEMEIVDRNERHLLVHCTDITAKKEVEAAMQQARDTALHTAELQSQFLANMSHEIRTPVNGILGMAQLLLDGELEGEARDNAMIIQSCGQTLLTLINDILDLSKLDAGKVSLEPMETNLRRVVQEVITLMEPRADGRGNSLEMDYPLHAAIPTHAVVDPVRLRQVLLNLLGNAVKFTENGSICVRVRCHAPEGNVGRFVFEVEDTGIGIAEDKLEQIFERFVQAEASTTRKFGGTGLGLPITKQLTELMGGRIAVQSSEYGTLFRVELPLTLCHPVSEQKATDAGNGDALAIEGLRVLVAEDNPVNQKITSRMLSKMGCVVQVVENGEDAASAAQTGEFDMVLMDCMMPGVDGYEGTRRIRAHEATTGQHLPIIALTARAMEGDRERCIEAGMDDYLTKPFSVAGLQGLMLRWLKQTSVRPGA